MATIEEREAAIAKRRADRAEANDLARREQRLVDLEALDALEAEHGHERVFGVDLIGWQAGTGATTMVVYRLPLSSESVWRRFAQQANATNQSAQQKVDAAEALARVCIVYPSNKDAPEMFRATVEQAAGILGNVAKQIAERLQGAAQQEEK